jgi:hypothetical protein
MKKNKQTIQGDEIDLVDLIRQLFQEKVLILFISIIFGLLAFLHAYSKNKNVEFKIEGKFRSESLLETNNELIKSDFDYHFINFKNFNTFLEQKENEDFKQVLKLNNLSSLDYFLDQKLKILPKINKSNLNLQEYSFSFIYPKEIDGVSFIINYLEFTKKNKNFIDRKHLKKIYQKEIDNHLRALDISKKIKIEMPMPMIYRSNDLTFNDLSFKGSIYLSEQINYLQKISSEIDNNEFFRIDYLINKPVTIGNKSLSMYFITGLILGLLLSLLIIFCKKIYIKSSKLFD